MITEGADASTTSGWASYETAGSVYGVATFELRNEINLDAIAGVLGSTPLSHFTIPVEVSEFSYTGFAIANQSATAPITVQFTLLDESGLTIGSTRMARLDPLYASNQIADFVNSAFPAVRNGFKGTLVAEVVGSGTMVAVGLTVKEGMLSAIPVIPEGSTPPPATCGYSISPTNRSHTAVAETGSVSVTANSGCSWTARSNVPWVTITGGSGGAGDGSITYSVAANTGQSSRSGTITISGQNYSQDFQVSQAAQTASSSKQKAEKILGNWTFTYTIVSTWHDKFSLTRVYQDPENPAQWYAVGTDEYGYTVVAGWGDSVNLYMLLDSSLGMDQVYTFDFTGPNTVAGCYYLMPGDDPDFSNCYPLTGIRTVSMTRNLATGTQDSAALILTKFSEAQSLGTGRGAYNPGLPVILESLRRAIR